MVEIYPMIYILGNLQTDHSLSTYQLFHAKLSILVILVSKFHGKITE